MAYFSNGTEGELYQERYCLRCVHGQDGACPVWDAHLLFAGCEEQVQDVLDTLIPNAYGWPGECLMFIPCGETTAGEVNDG